MSDLLVLLGVWVAPCLIALGIVIRSERRHG